MGEKKIEFTLQAPNEAAETQNLQLHLVQPVPTPKLKLLFTREQLESLGYKGENAQ